MTGPDAPLAFPDATVARLPVYHRCLMELEAEGRATVSSEQLADLAGVNAAKVRKDLSYFGSYGTRGVGYDVERLLIEIRRELGLTHNWKCVIVGRRATSAPRWPSSPASPTAASPSPASSTSTPTRWAWRSGTSPSATRTDWPRSWPPARWRSGSWPRRPRPRRTPPTALVAAGIRSILNFAPTVLDVPPEVLVRDVDLAVELQILAFHEGRREGRDVPATRPGRLSRGSRGVRPMSLSVELRLDGRRCVVVGGGRIGTRRAMLLIDAGAVVTVVAPEASEELRDLAAGGRLSLLARRFRARRRRRRGRRGRRDRLGRGQRGGPARRRSGGRAREPGR